LTYERYVKDPEGHKNVSIFSVASKSIIFQFTQKTLSNWGVQWTMDESIFGLLVTNEVQFYKVDSMQSGTFSLFFFLPQEWRFVLD
jgi:translation initiation factor 2A